MNKRHFNYFSGNYLESEQLSPLKNKGHKNTHWSAKRRIHPF